MKQDLRETILDIALPLIEAQGLVLWGLDVIAGPTLRVVLYVDVPPDEHGNRETPSASIEQCEAISRQLSLAMDVADCIEQPWTLEVSSPGLERKFYTPAQLAPYTGDILDVRLNAPLGENGRKTWRGRLLGASADSFELEPVSLGADGTVTVESNEPVQIKWDNVARAQRVHIFATPQKPGKAPARKRQ